MQIRKSVQKEAESILDIDRSARAIYSTVARHQELKAFLEEEEKQGVVDDIDSEIQLGRAIIKLLVSDLDDVSDIALDESGNLTLNSSSKEAREILRAISDLSGLVKRKYEILHLAGEVIPRTVVQAYIQQLGLAIDRVARNTCSQCGHEHKMRDILMGEFQTIQAI